MSHDVLAIIAAAVVTLLAGVYTTRATNKAKSQTETAQAAIASHQVDVDRVRADGEALDRAQAIYKEILNDLREEVGRLQITLAELRLQLRAEETRSAALEVKIANLQRSVTRLSTLLEENDIPIPSLGDH